MQPLPDFLTNVPDTIQVVNAPASDEDVDIANRIRAGFALPGAAPEFMKDIVRGFRLIDGAKTYIEVGSGDKGNLAWLSERLDPAALMIDVEDTQDADLGEKFLATVKPSQKVAFIEGDSIAQTTLTQVKQALDGRLADGIFLNGSHLYDHFLTELGRYWPLLRPGGALFIHDIFWEGTDAHKGKAQACMQINATIPVWCICRQDPVHRYMLQAEKIKPRWGGLGLIQKPAL